MKRIQFFRPLALGLCLWMLLGLVSPVLAQGIVGGDTVASQVTIDNDLVLFGQEVTLDGTVNGNVFVLGNHVNVRGKINGSLVAVGQNVVLDGQVDGTVYSAALTVDAGDKSSVTRDLYAAAVSLTSQPGAGVGRDLFALGLDAGLSGKVGRSLHTMIGPLQLYNGIVRLLGFEELAVDLHFPIRPPQENQAPLPATTPTPAPGGWLPQLGAGAGLGVDPLAVALAGRSVDETGEPFDWNAWAVRVLRDWASLFVLGLIALWLLRKPLARGGDSLRAGPWKSTGWGVLVLVVSFNLFGVALVLVALIFLVGLWLGWLGLWGLAIAWWSAAYALLGVLVTVLWIFVVYGTKILVTYVAADWLLSKIWEKRWPVISLLLGTIVYVLLRSIPYAGLVIGFLVTSAGMGAAWFALRTPVDRTAGAGRRPLSVPVSTAGTVPALAPDGTPLPARHRGRPRKTEVVSRPENGPADPGE